MHEDIKRFPIHGELLDRKLSQTKDELVRFIEDQMRDEGYVPLLDIDPQMTVDYGDSKYKFVLSVYGAYLGKGKCSQVSGISNGKQIMKYIPTRK